MEGTNKAVWSLNCLVVEYEWDQLVYIINRVDRSRLILSLKPLWREALSSSSLDLL